MRLLSLGTMRTALSAIVLLGPAGASALDAEGVFNRVESSVWTVQVYNSDGKLLGQGSAVTVAPQKVVTNCHVLAKSNKLTISRGKEKLDATLEFPDIENDLCQLDVPGLQSKAVAIRDVASLRIGERVYAIGSPQGLELSISEGIISSVRTFKDPVQLVQTTAPISPGSSGGGLFDSDARLVGITSLSVVGRERIAQNLNFAHPASLIAELPIVGAAAMAELRNKPGPAKSAPTPVPPVASSNAPPTSPVPQPGRKFPPQVATAPAIRFTELSDSQARTIFGTNQIAHVRAYSGELFSLTLYADGEIRGFCDFDNYRGVCNTRSPGVRYMTGKLSFEPSGNICLRWRQISWSDLDKCYTAYRTPDGDYLLGASDQTEFLSITFTLNSSPRSLWRSFYGAEPTPLDSGTANQPGETPKPVLPSIAAPATTPERSPTQAVLSDGRPLTPPQIVGGTSNSIELRWQFDAERLARTTQCTTSPRPTLVARGPGFENYAMSCTDGDVVTIRCELGGCRILH